MRKRVYIETTIPSHYFSRRSDVQSLAIREWTREWWDQQRTGFDLVTSLAVLAELEAGEHPDREAKVNLLRTIPLLEDAPEIPGIVRAYIDNRLMPSDASGDAAHLAFASFFSCDYLLTWNCRHLANPNKNEHIRKINQRLGLAVPVLLTPHALLCMEET